MVRALYTCTCSVVYTVCQWVDCSSQYPPHHRAVGWIFGNSLAGLVAKGLTHRPMRLIWRTDQNFSFNSGNLTMCCIIIFCHSNNSTCQFAYGQPTTCEHCLWSLLQYPLFSEGRERHWPVVLCAAGTGDTHWADMAVSDEDDGIASACGWFELWSGWWCGGEV